MGAAAFAASLVCLASAVVMWAKGAMTRRRHQGENDPAPLLPPERAARPPMSIRIHSSPPYPPRQHDDLDLDSIPDMPARVHDMDQWVRRACDWAEDERRERAMRARWHSGEGL
jgi:hypothetical protein